LLTFIEGLCSVRVEIGVGRKKFLKKGKSERTGTQKGKQERRKAKKKRIKEEVGNVGIA
jgi:hypothetical protein